MQMDDGLIDIFTYFCGQLTKTIMKKLAKSILLIAAVALVAPACKKGDNDPGLSLKSRASRLAGEWSLDSYTLKTNTTERDSDGDRYVTDSELTLTGNSATSKSTTTYTPAVGTGSTSTSQLTGTVSDYKVTIEKEGTYKRSWTIKNTSSSVTFGGTTVTNTIDNTSVVEEEGTWQFLNKNKSEELKNKEAVMFAVTKRKTTVTNRSTTTSDVSTDVTNETFGKNRNVTIWTLDRLAKDELSGAGSVDETSNGTVTSTFGSLTTTVSKDDVTTTGTLEIKLKKS
jgi:hypothetical protein